MPVNTWPDMPQPEFHSYLPSQEAAAPENLLTTDNRDLIMQANMEDAIARATELLAASHQHEFTYLLNNNHTALRGCKCGLAFVGLMAGPSPDALQWHQIHEENEQG